MYEQIMTSVAMMWQHHKHYDNNAYSYYYIVQFVYAKYIYNTIKTENFQLHLTIE